MSLIKGKSKNTKTNFLSALKSAKVVKTKVETPETIILEEANNCEFIHGVDDTSLTLEGIVTFVCQSGDDLFFKINTETFNNSEVLCVTKPTIPIRKYDRAHAYGTFSYIVFEGKRRQCFICDEDDVSAFYFFDLNNLLITTFPDIKDQEELNIISERIVTYAEDNYTNQLGIQSVVDCLNELSENIREDNSFDDFTEAIFGDAEKNRTRVARFLKVYCDGGVKRPLKLLGLSEKEIDSISNYIDLTKAYRIAIENPYRIPHITLDQCDRICKNILRMDKIPQLWKDCGNVNREVYTKLTKQNWTSVPEQKMIRMFPHTYTDNKELLLNDYFLSEEFGSIYFEPVRRKEKNVADFIAKLMTKPPNNIVIPLYPGFKPDEFQNNAIIGALENNISIITGGAGVGKTQIMGEICRAISNMGYTPICLSYTGSAVQRIKESLEDANMLDYCSVSTIHMACGNSNNYKNLPVKYILLDEASMNDLPLMSWFINKFSFIVDISIIVIGDYQQLEPMSYGNFLAQLLKTTIPLFKLEKNYRSQKGILKVINDIIDEERFEKQLPIDWKTYNYPDFKFMLGGRGVTKSYIQKKYDRFFEINKDEYNNLENATDLEVENFENKFLKYRDRITMVNGFVNVKDELNVIFQEIFMQEFQYVIIDDMKFHLKERVIKTINNNNIDVMNGETGIVTEIMSDYIVVKFRTRRSVSCPFFSKTRLKKVKDILKLFDYSPFIVEEGKKIDKSNETIKIELEEYHEKLSNVKNLSITGEDLDAFFEIAIQYPFAIFSTSNDKSEFLNISSLDLGYACTSRKAQGKGFDETIVVLYHPYSTFITRRQMYTMCSRGKEELTLIVESEELLNSCILTPDRYVYDNLALRINDKLPQNLKTNIIQNVTVEEEIDEYGDIDDTVFDDYDDDGDIF